MKANFQIDPFWGINTLQKTAELYEVLNQPIFTLKNLELTQRTVMHWDNIGLLNIQRESTENWRRFSFVDYTWLHIIKELRNIGLPLHIIYKAKEAILESISLKWLIDLIKINPELIDTLEHDDSLQKLRSVFNADKIEAEDVSLNTLLILIVDSISKRKPVSLMIFHDGYTVPFSEMGANNYTDEVKSKMIYETYVVISVTAIIKRFLTNPRSSLVIEKLNILDDNEKHLLDLINTGKYDSITIHFKNQKMKSLELIKDQDVKRKIVDVIADSSYQDIVVKRHKGMITKIQNTIKVMLD